MTIAELQIQLDLNPDNRVNIVWNTDTCFSMSDVGYLFVDQEDGQCYLFDNNINLDDISKVKIIRDGEFYNCSSLTSIKIPNSIERIGASAFENCTSLTNIKIPSSVKSIERWTFAYCSSLTSIKIPDSIESIGCWAFFDCTSLKELVFKGKIMKQVKAMKYYPWGIIDESIIKTES